MTRNFQRSIRPLKKRFKGWLYRRKDFPLPIWWASAFALILLIALVALYFISPWIRQGYWAGVYVEASGLLLEVIVFGVLLAITVHWWDEKRDIQRYQEEIQDFKHWDAEEGRLRIAGAVRRLERLGRTDIDFGGIKLQDFSFISNDIKSIRRSTFYEGLWEPKLSKWEVILDKVDFSYVDCSDVVFCRSNPWEGLSLSPPVKITNCTFRKSNLKGALFNGAVLEWTEAPPAEIYEEVENPDGSPGCDQIEDPPFDGADLAGTSFGATQFRNADFRNAENIDKANFSGARGLESCVFDSDSVKAAVLRMASESGGV